MRLKDFAQGLKPMPILLYAAIVAFVTAAFCLPPSLRSHRLCELYYDGCLCIGGGTHSTYEQRNLGGGGQGAYDDIIIRDGGSAPVAITYDVPWVGLPYVQMVSPNAVNIVFGSYGRSFSYFWVYDRQTRKVAAFNTFAGRLLTLMPSGDDVLMVDDDGLYLADGYMQEQRRFPFHPSDESVIASSPSPSGQRVAVATWNGQYEEADAVWKVYLLDLNAGDVTLLGESTFLEQLEWAGEGEVSAVSGSIGGKEKVIAKTFTVNP